MPLDICYSHPLFCILADCCKNSLSKLVDTLDLPQERSTEREKGFIDRIPRDIWTFAVMLRTGGTTGAV